MEQTACPAGTGCLTASSASVEGFSFPDRSRVDNLSRCVEQMDSQLYAMQDQLYIMDRELDTIMDYLNTPQWRRPELPLK